MAFISYDYISYDYKGTAESQHIFSIKDSEFGDVLSLGVQSIWEAIVAEYSKRGLNVGRNLALAVIWHVKDNRSKNFVDSSSELLLTRWQDSNCPAYIENWAMYAKERDEHLEKLLPLL